MGNRTGLVFDPLFERHDPGKGHPDCPARYRALQEAFSRSGLLSNVIRLKTRDATDEDLHLCHTRAYLKTVQRDMAQRAAVLSTGDTALGEASEAVARAALGSVLGAVDAVMTGEVRNAFAAVRPPGHHATSRRGMGFCIYNHVAAAARHAQRMYGVDRVLIADWDVHHGNGTQDFFYADRSVFYFSTHQWPWYPGTGTAEETGVGAGQGTTMNCPLPAGSGRRQIVGAFRKKLIPAMDAFRPELVIVSAGFDSRAGDPLGGFRLKDSDFAELTSVMLEIAARHAQGRLVSVLEGGYNLEGLARAALAHLETLCA